MITTVKLPWLSWRTWQKVLTYYRWACGYCGAFNQTPALYWNTVKYQLICRNCRCMQSYPDYIKVHDPEPPLGKSCDPSSRG